MRAARPMAKELNPMGTVSLGVDLASKNWRDIGFALVASDPSNWGDVQPGCLRGSGALTPEAVAEHIDRFARERGVDIVCLDGPQGWREPNADKRPGVGRLAEYEARTQGKTGVFGRTYPQTQHGWIDFSIRVFDALLCAPGVMLGNANARLERRPAGYWVTECFPTMAWRDMGLPPLPGKSSSKGSTVTDWADLLWSSVGLPGRPGAIGHDDLQAVVAAIAGAAAVSSPRRHRVYGKPAWDLPATEGIPSHRVEGFIWGLEAIPGSSPSRRLRYTPDDALSPLDATHPFLADERSEVGDEALARGAMLFEELVALANSGYAVGIDYAFFVATVHGAKSFRDLIGRNFAPCDIRSAVRLAIDITAAAGGRRKVRRGATEIDAGMDSFVWNQSGDRSAKAWGDPVLSPPYSQADWRRVFPDELRVVRTRDNPNPQLRSASR